MSPPSAFVTPSLPPVVVLNTPCGNMRSHLFTWKSATGTVPACSAFGRKNKWVLSFKKKTNQQLFFFFSVLFYISSHVFLPPLQPSALEAGFHQEGPLCLSWWLCYTLCTRGMAKEGQAQWNFTQSSSIQPYPDFPVSLGKMYSLAALALGLYLSIYLSTYLTVCPFFLHSTLLTSS